MSKFIDDLYRDLEKSKSDLHNAEMEVREKHTIQKPRDLNSDSFKALLSVMGENVPDSAKFHYLCTFCKNEVSHTCCVDFVKQREKSTAEEKKNLRTAKAKVKLSAVGFSKRQMRNSFKTFEVTEENKQHVEAAKNYSRDFSLDNPRNLILYGAAGRGKTHLTSAVVRNIAIKHPGLKIKFGSFMKMLMEIKSNGFSEENSVVEAFKSFDLLVLDDLGKEHITDWSKQILYLLINERYEDERPTIITTNCTSEELAKKIDPATISRLMEGSVFIKMTGSDYRLKGGEDVRE